MEELYDFNSIREEEIKDKEKIGIRLNSKRTFIEMAKVSKTVATELDLLAKHNFIFYKKEDNVDYFIKRKKFLDVYHMILQNKYERINDFYYKFEGDEDIDKLVFVFNPGPLKEHKYSPSVDLRCFRKVYPDLVQRLNADTGIIRIPDIGLVHGTGYFGTSVDEFYEEEFIEFIEVIIDKYGITRENIVFYGVGKGAMAALYYASIFQVKSLAVNLQILDESEYYQKVLENYQQEEWDRILNKVNTHLRTYIASSVILHSVKYDDVIEKLNCGRNIKFINVDKVITPGSIYSNSLERQVEILKELSGGRK